MVATFHPSHHVTSLAETEAWFAHVFGRSSTSMQTVMAAAPPRPGYPNDYSTFTPIRDVLMDSVDPELYVVGGVQYYASVDEPHLKNLGWYVEGMPELFAALRAAGYGVADQFEQLADDEPPLPTFFSVPQETGMRHQFFLDGVFKIDPRQREGWVLPPVEDDDPLGIERCSHHTILTDDVDRQLRLVVDVLGGVVFHEGRDELRGTTTTSVFVGDTVLQYAVPDAGTPADADWKGSGPLDTYHAITWRVADLERAERQLVAEGVKIQARSADAIVTDPATSLGIPWGFTTALTPGDPRGSVTAA